VFIEFTETAAVIANDARAVELPIERDTTGALTPPSADAFRNTLSTFATASTGAQAFCLLPARGVSLRRISLPAANNEAIDRLLPLQIDAHFPLSSEELAWGHQPLSASVPSREGAPLKELLVAAVRKTSLQPYRELIASAGFTPLFAIAAIVRAGACPHGLRNFAILEIGPRQSELVTFDESSPATLRVIGVGNENAPSAEPLLAALQSSGSIEKVFISGKGSSLWSARLAPSIVAEPLATHPGHTAAITGLRETLRHGHEPLLIHASREAVRVQRSSAQWTWAAAAAILFLIYLALPLVESRLRKTQLARNIAELRAAREKLPKVDREAAFLQYIHTNQPNYLEVVAQLAAANQPGMKLDALNMAKRGELSLRGQAQNPQAVGTLRSKMIDSGAFANVVIDEQTPTQPGQQQVNFRMTAQLIPERDRKPPPPKPVAEKPPAGSTNKAPTKATAPKKSDAPATPDAPQPTEAP
jgi:hypothetical protein